MATKQSVRTDFFMLPCEVRLLWPHLAEKRTTDHENKPLPPDKQYYDVTILIPKTASDPAQCRNYQFLMQRMQQIIQQQFDGAWPADASREGWPIKDCDQDQTGLAKHPFTKGHWKISPWSNFQPRVVDSGNNDIPRGLDGQFLGFKGGDYGFVSINAWGWPNCKGISFGVEGVKKTRDGDPVGGNQRSVSQMFGGPEPAPMAPPLPSQGFPAAAAPQYAPIPMTPAPAAAAPVFTPQVQAVAPAPYAQPAGYVDSAQYAAQPQVQPPFAAPGAQPAYGAPQQPPGFAPPPPGAPVAPPVYGAPQQPPGFAPPPFGTR